MNGDGGDGWRETRFGELSYDDEFRVRGQLWERVPKEIDRLGGYNAQQVGTGWRGLFYAHEVVEVRVGQG